MSPELLSEQSWGRLHGPGVMAEELRCVGIEVAEVLGSFSPEIR